MAEILFSLHVGDGHALYRQIVEQVKAAIASGRLKAGDRLPTHRDLARTVVVAPLTVKHAYDVLQAEGLITMRQGKGTFVAGQSGATPPAAIRELSSRAEGLIRQARLMNLSPDDLKRLINATWKEEG